MLLIPCPWCGDRHETEFVCGGEAVKPREQAIAARLGDDAWIDYLTNRENRRGPHREFWWHARGCGQWFVLRRDTLTHEFLPDEEKGS
jgi:sarcosine oxidase, subunit delta